MDTPPIPHQNLRLDTHSCQSNALPTSTQDPYINFQSNTFLTSHIFTKNKKRSHIKPDWIVKQPYKAIQNKCLLLKIIYRIEHWKHTKSRQSSMLLCIPTMSRWINNNFHCLLPLQWLKYFFFHIFCYVQCIDVLIFFMHSTQIKIVVNFFA